MTLPESFLRTESSSGGVQSLSTIVIGRCCSLARAVRVVLTS